MRLALTSFRLEALRRCGLEHPHLAEPLVAVFPKRFGFHLAQLIQVAAG